MSSGDLSADVEVLNTSNSSDSNEMTDVLELSVEEEDDTAIESPNVITQSMVEEEEKLEREEFAIEQQNEKKIEVISKEERLDRLGILLQKSKVYADSLLKVIEEKKEAERKRALKKEKRAKKKQNAILPEKAFGGSTQNRKRKRDSTGTSSTEKRSKQTKQLNKADHELLQLKLYTPKAGEVISQVRDVDGVRYLGDQLVHVSQPTLFTGGILRDYQILGYQWLKVLFTNAVNGILADEMGLGKTIQCIALICQIVKMGFKGPFLVCAPLSTIANWVSEFKMFAPSIPVLLYHGSAPERMVLARYINVLQDGCQCYPVVVTSFEVLLRDRPVLARHRWEYMILDEGHRIKNPNCRLFKELRLLNVGTKLLLTGTPLQNNLKELWSLLNFTIPEVFDDFEVFESWLDFGNEKYQGSSSAFTFEQEERFLSSLYEILTPFLLRRLKSDVKLELPPKTEMIVYAPFSKKQEQFYEAAVAKTIRNLVDDVKPRQSEFHRTILSDVSNARHVTRSKTEDLRIELDKRTRRTLEDRDIHVSLNNIVMLLRKCCNHPYLIEYPLIPGTDIFKVDEDIVTVCGKMMILDRILPKLAERNHKVLLFSQMTNMLDIIQDYLQLRNYKNVRLDGKTKMDDRQKNIREFNSNPDIFIFLLSTRAGGLGINLTAADTVIIYDSDWNPQNDLQAQDRCHRIGQTRPVKIYRLVTASSIDQKMVERAAEKRKLEKMVMHKNKFKGNLYVELKQKMKIGKSEILRMIQSSDFNTVVNADKVMSDEELEKILDRSALLTEDH